MTKFPLIATLLLATVAAPALAAPAAKTSFTHDGVTYVYSQTKVGKSVVLRGTSSNGPDFYYVVRNGQVVGKNGGTAVSFRVEDAAQLAGQVEVTSVR